MEKITDIWFKSALQLEDIASSIGLKNIYYDAENYWEWVEGVLIDHKLNISRSHKLEPIDAITRVFLPSSEDKLLPNKLIDMLVLRLKDLGISPIYCGNCEYLNGNEFSFHQHRVIT